MCSICSSSRPHQHSSTTQWASSRPNKEVSQQVQISQLRSIEVANQHRSRNWRHSKEICFRHRSLISQTELYVIISTLEVRQGSQPHRSVQHPHLLCLEPVDRGHHRAISSVSEQDREATWIQTIQAATWAPNLDSTATPHNGKEKMHCPPAKIRCRPIQVSKTVCSHLVVQLATLQRQLKVTTTTYWIKRGRLMHRMASRSKEPQVQPSTLCKAVTSPLK